MTASAARQHPAAAIISDWLEPRTWVIVTTLAVGAAADGLAGAGWAVLAVISASVLPTLLISRRVRHGQVADRHLHTRQQRLPVMAFIIAVIAACLVLLAFAGAPRAVIAQTSTMLAAVTVLTVVTAWWKISLHCAASAGGVTILIITFGPALAAGYVLTLLIAWSRVVLRDHSVAQAAAGIAAGLASALVYLVLR